MNPEAVALLRANRIIRNLLLMQTRRDLQMAMSALDQLILATPSGDARNKLADMNLHLMEASSILQSLPLEI